MKALKDMIRKRKNRDYISPKEIYEIIEKDEDVKDIIDEFIENLSIGICDYIDIFEPEAISLGGSFAYYQDILLPKLLDRLHKGKMTFNGEIPEIVIAEYGNDAGIIGATLLG